MSTFETIAETHLLVRPGRSLSGEVSVSGAKNAALCAMAALLLARGVSRLYNVPAISDVLTMIELLRSLGACVTYDARERTLCVTANSLVSHRVQPQMMRAMRASLLVMGPLLARLGQAFVPYPGGCGLTRDRRGVDYHVQAFRDLGVVVSEDVEGLDATVVSMTRPRQHSRVVLDYPSVGTTENIIMYAALGGARTTIINAALEPEVIDLIALINKMGGKITCLPGAIIEIEGVSELHAVEYTIMPDRLEAGSLLLAAAITGGEVSIPNIDGGYLEIFLDKLRRMGHEVTAHTDSRGVRLCGIAHPQAVGFKTGPYPGFPTDLQAPMMVAQLVARGSCVIEETVFDKRLTHVAQLRTLGARIDLEDNRAMVHGGERLVGGAVVAENIRASCALVLAGLVAEGETSVHGITHWRRGYEKLEEKLLGLGADIRVVV